MSDYEYSEPDWLVRCRQLYSAGRAAEAVNASDQVLARDRDPSSDRFTIASMIKSFALLELERNRDALATLNTIDVTAACLSGAPPFSLDRFYRCKGYALYGIGRNEEAVKAFAQEHTLNPDANDDSWAIMGDALRRLGRHEEAMTAVIHALNKDPKSENGLICMRKLVADMKPTSSFIEQLAKDFGPRLLTSVAGNLLIKAGWEISKKLFNRR